MSAEQLNRSLREVFTSTFHTKMSFEEFLGLNVDREYEIIRTRKREIYKPSSKLKKIHKFINNTIFEYADFNENVVFSYRKGASVRDAVVPHAINKYFFQTDISNFYGSIRSQDVQHTLKNQLDNVPISDVANYIQRIIELVVIDDHIPAGFSSSPILSNICLFDFDNALLKHCQSQNLTYTRYSDDLIISGESKESVRSVRPFIEKLLKKSLNGNPEINQSKTKLHTKGHSFKMLGFSILPNGVITISSSSKKEIETMIYLYLTNAVKFNDFVKKNILIEGEQEDEQETRDRGLASLSGKIISTNSMDKYYIQKLRKKYGNTVIDMFIRKSVK